MSISHHPSDETLRAFAAGSLDESRAVVVAAHLSLCPQCRQALHAFESVAGALLDRLAPSEMRSDALDRTLARVGLEPEPRPDYRHAAQPGESGLPRPLMQYELGPWRRIGFGVLWRSVGVPAEDGHRVFMLKAKPGIRLPQHRHRGTEWTCVFQGAFRHQLGRFGPGDFDEADESVEHHPTVEDGEPCICLVALGGGIELRGPLGRLLQPFIRL